MNTSVLAGSSVKFKTFPLLLASSVLKRYECPFMRFKFGSLTYTSAAVPPLLPVVTFAAVVEA